MDALRVTLPFPFGMDAPSEDDPDETALVPPDTERALRLFAEANPGPPNLASSRPDRAGVVEGTEVSRPPLEGGGSCAKREEDPISRTKVMHLGRLLAPSPVEAWRRRSATRARAQGSEVGDVARGPGSTLVVRPRSVPPPASTRHRAVLAAVLALSTLGVLAAIAHAFAS